MTYGVVVGEGNVGCDAAGTATDGGCTGDELGGGAVGGKTFARSNHACIPSKASNAANAIAVTHIKTC